MKITDVRAGTADCDVNPFRHMRQEGDEYTCGEWSINTDLTEDEIHRVHAVQLAGRGLRDGGGKRLHFRISAPLAIAIVKCLAAESPSEAAFATVRGA